MKIGKFQIGKNGITQGVVDSLALLFKNHNQVKISMLKSSGRNREVISQMALEIAQKLSLLDKKHIFNHRIIGFTIVMIRELKH